VVVGQHRSTQRLERPALSDDEAELRAWLRAFAVKRPRWDGDARTSNCDATADG